MKTVELATARPESAFGMNGAAFVQLVKRRLEGSNLMSHLTSRHRSLQEDLVGAEVEVLRLGNTASMDTIVLAEASTLFKAKLEVVTLTATLRSNAEKINAYQGELKDLERLIHANRVPPRGLWPWI